MAIKPNHVIVNASDEDESAASFTEPFDLPPPVPFGPFLDADVANEMTFAFLEIVTRPYET